MEPSRRARWLAWTAISILVLAAPLFFVPGGGDSYGDHAWAIAGVVALHPAAFAGMGAFFTYRELDEGDKANARVARLALPVVLVGIGLLWLFWT